MPMKRSEKICKNCLYYEKSVSECRHSISFIQHTEDSWCSEGWWRSWSGVTNQWEDYELVDDDLNYMEKRGFDKNDLYIVMSSSDQGFLCEVFDTMDKVNFYIKNISSTHHYKLFKLHWNTVDECWVTNHVNLRVCAECDGKVVK